MRAATRHHLRSLVLIVSLLVAMLLIGGRATQWMRNLVVKIRARGTVAWMAMGME